MTDAPDAYRQAGIAMMCSGAVNLVLSATWALGLLGSIYGICCCPLPILFAAIAVGELRTGLRIHQGEPQPRARAMSALGALAGVLMCLGVLSLVLEVVVLALLGRPEVRAWLEARALSGTVARPG